MSRDIISHSNYLNQLSTATLPTNIKGFFIDIINWITLNKTKNNNNNKTENYNNTNKTEKNNDVVFIYEYDEELHLSPLSTRSDPSEPSLSPPPPSPI